MGWEGGVWFWVGRHYCCHILIHVALCIIHISLGCQLLAFVLNKNITHGHL